MVLRDCCPPHQHHVVFKELTTAGRQSLRTAGSSSHDSSGFQADTMGFGAAVSGGAWPHRLMAAGVAGSSMLMP